MKHLAPVFVIAMILAFIASREHGSFSLPQLGRLNDSPEDEIPEDYVFFEILIIVIVAVLVTSAAALLAPETFAGTF